MAWPESSALTKGKPAGAFASEPASAKRPARSKRGLSATLRRGSSCTNPAAQKPAAPATVTNKTILFVENAVDGISSDLLRKLYQAKCADLRINQQQDQERRFTEFCSKNVRRRRLALRDAGLGVQSVAVINTILRK